MPIEFRCPSCQKLLRTPDATAGKQGRCPHCQALMQIPEAPAQGNSPDSPAPAGGMPAGADPYAPPPPPSPQTSPTPQAPKIDLFGSSSGSAPAPAPPSAPASWDKSQNLFGGAFGVQGGQTSGAGAGQAMPFNLASQQPTGNAPSGFGAPAGYGMPGQGHVAGAHSGGYTSGAPASPYSSGSFTNPYAAPKGGYGEPAPHWGPMPHRGSTILALGIMGVITNLGGLLLCCCCPLLNVFVSVAGLGLGIPAWVMGQKDLRAMNEGRMDPSGRGATQTGMIMGIVCVVLTALSILLTILHLVFGIAVNMQEFQNI